MLLLIIQISKEMNISGINAVLIGARSTEYVNDVLTALQIPVPNYDRADWLGMKLH
jgi:aryl-alcohol dehydrogenase-like predicted oxidoreductase